MKLRTLFTITAALAIIFGIGFLLAPAMIWSLYGVTLDTAGVYLAQLFGTANIGMGLVIWCVSRTDSPEVHRSLALGIFGWCLVEEGVILLGQLGGVTNILGWGFVTIDLALLLAYGYVLLAKPTPVRQSA